MRISDALAVPRGITAVVGGGGKTSLIDRLSAELSERGTVIRCATAHMYPPNGARLLSPTDDQVRLALAENPLLAVGEPADNGKWTFPRERVRRLARLCDYVLAEADGSRGLPFKAPADHEPALPLEPDLVIAVAGVSGLEQPIERAAHRPERFTALLGVPPQRVITPELAVRVIEHPQGLRKGVTGRFCVLLNQADTPGRLAAARACAALLTEDTLIAALQAQPDLLEHWRNGKCLC
ncbi:MAG: selenium cofactor biosynthesis protein YqeC [Eubacteriales bacterium]|nr:selenium cofactor biosynthesis protein YqeC [Eubacteriales bacterium]